ncbi:hypothetical protein FKV24_003685 [Lysobacter maris]|uniref:Uncharacterized protein n=1 Tax=Marilutibacter maris TaxID=1605891 RepID=A0A508B139_9GAMM|nr:hypothetical protein [Lysobacter maris]KAB8198143.1 hypothetical protein FKV24_003685 [Lysobacter maris]
MSKSSEPRILAEARLGSLDRNMDAMEAEMRRLIRAQGEGPTHARWRGAASERFCRQVLDALDCFPEVLPEPLDAADVRKIIEAELQSIERLRLRRDRLHRLAEHADEVLAAAGGNVMETTMEAYMLLARANRARGITVLSGWDDLLP